MSCKRLATEVLIPRLIRRVEGSNETYTANNARPGWDIDLYKLELDKHI